MRSESATVYDLTQSYLDWCERNRKPGTYENHLKYLKSLIESIGKRLHVGKLRKHHLTKWLEGKPWGTTSQNDAISIVK